MASNYSTQTDLVNDALARVGVLIAGMSADPEDFAYVNNAVLPTMFKLAALNICQVPDTNSIPNQWFNDLSRVLAGEVCTKFGVSSEEYVRLTNDGLGGVNGVDVGQGAAAKSLREMNRGRPTYELLQVVYF